MHNGVVFNLDFLEAPHVICMLRISIEITIEGHFVHNNNKYQQLNSIEIHLDGSKENRFSMHRFFQVPKIQIDLFKCR